MLGPAHRYSSLPPAIFSSRTRPEVKKKFRTTAYLILSMRGILRAKIVDHDGELYMTSALQLQYARSEELNLGSVTRQRMDWLLIL